MKKKPRLLPAAAAAATATAYSSTCSGRQSWAALSDGPLHSILTQLHSFRDLLSFSSVCRSWRSLTHSTISASFTSLFPPFLLRPLLHHHNRRSSTLSGFHLLDPASHSSCPPPLSPISGESLRSLRFISASHGHLLFSSYLRHSHRIRLINSLTGRQHLSPFLPSNHEFSTSFALLTAPVSSPGSSVLLSTPKSLFHWQIGNPNWSQHSLGVDLTYSTYVAIAIQQSFFVMDSPERLFIINLSPEFEIKQLVLDWVSFTFARWLVDCGGELLLVCFVPTEAVIWAKLKVFRLDQSEERLRWVKMENLGDWALFVGVGSRVPGLACKNPERWGGRSNCIYFAAKDRDESWTVVELGDEIDTSDLECPLSSTSRTGWPVPVWFYPSMVF